MSIEASQPIHTVYGGAHLFRHDIAAKLGRIASKAFTDHGGSIPCTSETAGRVAAKLTAQAVEDYRIDFEDGYGYRPDEEEDVHAAAAARELAEGVKAGTLPPFTGIRIKSFQEHTRVRAVRTLRVFFGAARELPPNFTITLPKITAEEQVQSFLKTLDDLGISVPVELMVETPQCLRNLSSMLAVAGPRARGAHFGPYDFTSACGILSVSQGLRHPLCTHARNQMLIGAAGTGLWLSDGPTSIIPTGSPEDIARAWRIQWDDIHHALSTGFFQGWDVHPAQIPLRYAVVFTFYADALPGSGVRLKNFIQQSAQATRVGSLFDDAATAHGLRNFFLRAAACGAIDESAIAQHCGVSKTELEQLHF